MTVFDLDGTLVDTPRAIVETFTAAFGALDAPAPAAAAIRTTTRLPLKRAFGDLLGADPGGALVAEAIAHRRRLFKETELPRARELIFPGVAEGAAGLRARGSVLAVATSEATFGEVVTLAKAEPAGGEATRRDAPQAAGPRQTVETPQAVESPQTAESRQTVRSPQAAESRQTVRSPQAAGSR
ncbi:HAD hydrolase-like protein [Nonomuraea sp. N2-4H]|uniref:HAD family hydrolase n=1 Tax=Nonomuraea sp. N2-4H TaxID=3128898 RepID=UPI0032558D2F